MAQPFLSVNQMTESGIEGLARALRRSRGMQKGPRTDSPSREAMESKLRIDANKENLTQRRKGKTGIAAKRRKKHKRKRDTE
jgi:hypothetical protein